MLNGHRASPLENRDSHRGTDLARLDERLVENLGLHTQTSLSSSFQSPVNAPHSLTSTNVISKGGIAKPTSPKLGESGEAELPGSHTQPALNTEELRKNQSEFQN